MNNQEIIKSLNGLIEKNYDAENGYKNAVEHVDSSGLRAFFRQRAAQRYYFGHEIKDLIADLGGEVNKGGSVKGNLHRLWMNIKETFSGNSDEAILGEVERGEEAYIKEYQDFLKENEELPRNIRRVVERQLHNVESTLHQVARMEKA